MAARIAKNRFHLALEFASATVSAAWRKSKGKRGGNGGKGNKLKGLIQYTDVDEDKVLRLARRKQYVSKDVPLVKTPVNIWMRVVTDYGQVVMMNADQFDAGGAKNVASATPHFS